VKAAQAALSFFLPDRQVAGIVPISGGNVNDSLRVRLESGRQYLLQRLSPAVFSKPARIMDNLQRVTDHLHRQLRKKNTCFIQIPELIFSPAGAGSFKDREGGYWRLLTWIENSRTLPVPDSPAQGREIGLLLGCFHHLLATLDPGALHDPLPGFHQTPGYLRQYDRVCRQHPSLNRQESRCAAMIKEYRGRADILERYRNILTRSIIHGDPKAGNFLFARDRDIAISLIDLDTVMPGLLLYDLGDCLRSCCNPAGEEIEDPAGVVFDGEMFAALLGGYCVQALDLLNAKDRELMVDAAFLISFELGLRFFTDHLAGNSYFKVNRPAQNLQRALIQFHLAGSIDRQRTTLDLLWQRVIMAASRQHAT
jgi:thiamine kinase-like enzyme